MCFRFYLVSALFTALFLLVVNFYEIFITLSQDSNRETLPQNPSFCIGTWKERETIDLGLCLSPLSCLLAFFPSYTAFCLF